MSAQIGEPGQKTQPKLFRLARQIENMLSKDYHESEIVDAVTRANTPDLQLRSYLEGKGKVTLPALPRILRCHYEQKGTTELWKHLTSDVQSSKETHRGRKFDLTSQEADSRLKYDAALVQILHAHCHKWPKVTCSLTLWKQALQMNCCRRTLPVPMKRMERAKRNMLLHHEYVMRI